MIGFEDKNITLERFKHYLKISLNIESSDFKIHGYGIEKVVGTVRQFGANQIFADDEGSDEMVKFYVSFYSSKTQQKAIDFLKLLKTQIKEGTCKLSLVNPLYLGMNYGKISINNEDFTQISLEKCDLVLREGVYIKNRYLLCSIYKFTNYITNELQIKVLAFDNQHGLEYMIDLDYQDLLDMVDGNTKMLCSSKDIAVYITNNLAYFKNENDDEILVCENKIFFADYSSSFGGAEKLSNTDLINKSLVGKHNNKKKMLHFDQYTQTDFKVNLIHEAFDLLFDHYVPVYN